MEQDVGLLHLLPQVDRVMLPAIVQIFKATMKVFLRD